MDTRYRILAVQVGLVAPYLYPPLVKRNSEISESICSNWAKINHWLVVYLPLWKMMEFVSWDDYSIPNCFWKVIQNSMVPNHQSDYQFPIFCWLNSAVSCTTKTTLFQGLPSSVGWPNLEARNRLEKTHGNIKPRTTYGEQHENMEKSMQHIQVTWSTWRNRQNQSWWKWIILIMDCPLENLNAIESSKVPNRSPSMLLIGYTTHLLHVYPIYPLMPGKKQECLGGIVFPRSCG